MPDDKTRILKPEDLARLTAAAGVADERTRVLTAADAARLLAAAAAPGPGITAAEPPPPRLEGGKIVFYCDNGHRIAVNPGLAGKRGNCSKQGCGAPVVIPFPPGLEPAAEPPAPFPNLSELPGPAEPASAAVSPLPPVFEPAPSVAAPPPLPDLPPPPGPPAPEWNFLPDGQSSAGDLAGAAPPEAAATPWMPDPVEIDHPTARLVTRLWLERAHGGIVEVHLSGGSVILPEWYDPRWSCGSHAVFAAQAADGTLTLTAVAWDQVQKLVVRQVQGTPEGMFEP